MTSNTEINTASNASLDLRLERIVDIPKEWIWRAWTEPDLLMQWFCPLPWKTVACEMDLRAGGKFVTTMQSPEGQLFPNEGCYLELIPNQKLVWTNALQPGFRPSPMASAGGGAEESSFLFTVIVTMEDHEAGTKYTATAMHADESGRNLHDAMGFHQGWGVALDQLIAMVKKRA